MDWHNTVFIFHINFRLKGTLPRPHYAHNVVYLHVLQRIILARNPVVDTVASKARQVQDKTLFPRFGGNTETAHREGRLRKGARHLACLIF